MRRQGNPAPQHGIQAQITPGEGQTKGTRRHRLVHATSLMQFMDLTYRTFNVVDVHPCEPGSRRIQDLASTNTLSLLEYRTRSSGVAYVTLHEPTAVLSNELLNKLNPNALNSVFWNRTTIV